MSWLFRSVLVLLVYSALNCYTAIRLFDFSKRFLFLRGFVFWPLYAILAYGFIFILLFRLDRIAPLRLAGMYWPALFVYLLLFTLFFDAALWILCRTGLFQSICSLDPRFLRSLLPGIALGLSLAVMVYGTLHARNIKTANYDLSFPGRTELQGRTIRLVLVSDLHIGSTVGKDWTARIVDKVSGVSPDMICIAGDIFDSGLEGVHDPEGIAAELKRFRAPLGVYASLGNHDTDRRSGSVDGIVRFLRETGMIVLEDEALPVKGINGVYAAGRRDARPIGVRRSRLTARELAALAVSSGAVSSGAGNSSVPSGALIETAADSSRPFLILLDHQPVELPAEAEAGFDLVLCGHTHQGQFFPGNLFTERIFRKAGGTHYGYWHSGIDASDGAQAVITSGAGLWGPPVRIGTSSEIAVLDIQFGSPP